MYNILISDPLNQEGIEPLLKAKDVKVDIETGLKPEKLQQVISDYHALLVRSQTQVSADIINAGNNLKVIGRAGVGVDNIDLKAATQKGIMVLNAPEGNTISAAEHTFAMMMAVARNIPQAYKSLVGGEWNRKAFQGAELNRKVIGIIGLGRIGAEVAKRAKVFNMKVIAYDPFLTKERAAKLGIEKGELDEVIAAADFITVHTPLTQETKHLLNSEKLNKMKDGVRIINCARGGIINEDDLYDAIKDGKVAGAAIDVFENEPAVGHPLLTLPQVIATPHLGASTAEAQKNVAVDVSEGILKVLHDQPFRNIVNYPPIPSDMMKKLTPYFGLCEKMGEMAIQLVKEKPDEITISYSGELMDLETTPLTRGILKGVLSYYLSTKVNFINAAFMAKQHDIAYTVEKKPYHQSFTSLITLHVKTGNHERVIAGTLIEGYGPRIIRVGDYNIDISPEGHLLFVHHHDRPGLIGRVGSILGEHDVNIATMQVGRKSAGGQAIMMLSVDKKIEKDVISHLEKIDDIISVQEIDL
ncbi:phosphoglycerate dehydrogenase [Scopulibacillus cellulosilyticus]|uniref:D-3-phosphoglycerate dehydrogenase n=1 Tax=Scopulibacillus cellulosilyticus TaxID=2665665 RepID=A0ABW2PZP2_9BACL